MSGHRRRLLTANERRLWAEVVRAVTPLPGRARPSADEAPERAPAAEPPAPAAAAALPRVRPAAPASPAPLVPIEPGLRRAMSRGRRAVDAAIDLHGMRQDEAHAALVAFLRRSQRAGHRIVLVVTGKGAAGAEGALFGERGVLRRVAPHWLRLPDLRPTVLGFEEAAQRHGGAGALYVRLRRSPGAGEP